MPSDTLDTINKKIGTKHEKFLFLEKKFSQFKSEFFK